MSDTQATDVETPADAAASSPSSRPPTATPSDDREATDGADAAQAADATDLEQPRPSTTGHADAGDDTVASRRRHRRRRATSARRRGDEPTRPAEADKKSRVRQLEREGEVAADFLETLLDIADLDGDIDVDVDGDRAAIAIVDSEEGRVPRRLVGTDGKVLEALQELTRLAVQAETGERSRLMLDVAGHRAERRSALVELAKEAIAEVKDSGDEAARSTR